MKRLLIFLFSLQFVLISSAQTLDKTRVTLSMVNVTVEEFLDEVERQTKIEFLYKSDEVINLPRITVHEKNAVTRLVISKVLAGIGCDFKENNGIVVVRLIKPRNDPRTVSGIVLDENKEPVIGAQVRILGTQQITVTDAEGAFSFSQPIPEKAQLQVSFIGMETIVLPVKGNMVVNMRSDTQTLEGVVVTGIFTRKKESFTGSATTIQAEELKMVGNQNILQSLKTLDPSFAIIENETFGSDPNRLPDVEVRGKTSIVGLTEENFVNPNQPLFILDGFESTLSTVNDLDIMFNYGIFSFDTDHFYWKFVRGETWYELGAEPTHWFMRAYAEEHRPVYEQVLNLTPEQREAVWQAFVENYQPENRKYLYNFVFDNCATRPYLLIQNALGEPILSDYAGETGSTYRHFIRHYTGALTWANAGISLLFGP